MRFSTLLPAALAASVHAAHHDVTVGKDGALKFVPETLKAELGDTITYHFFAKNHSVIQSSFNEPCKPLSNGFYSAFVPTEDASVASRTTYTITVHDEKPIWVYCGQGPHCSKGMVQSINAPSTGNTHEAFKALAAKVEKTVVPPLDVPIGGLRKIRVDVGLDGLTFTPNNIVEPPHTVVKFSFHPKNHSVVQSSFDKPCQPLYGGFSSGSIPTALSPSGVEFDIRIADTKPIWFYCAQTTGRHCQSGMVGSINAPAEGEKTLAAFTELAKSAPDSTLPPYAPLVGTIFVNGTIVRSFNGPVFPGLNAGNSTHAAPLPPSQEPPTQTPNEGSGEPTSTRPPLASQSMPGPGEEVPDYYYNMAGGGKPTQWNWAPALSENATAFLYLHNRLENTILNLLWSAYTKLEQGGDWAGFYPKTITDTIGSWTAQSLIHRLTTEEALAHYQHALQGECTYKPLGNNVENFLQAFATLNLLQIGAIIDISSQIAAQDPFIVPILLTQVGSKSRAAGVVNMMQNHLASIAPREVSIPTHLVYSYLMTHYIESCPQTIQGLDAAYPTLAIPNTQQSNNRTTGISLKYESTVNSEGQNYVAWIGPYGVLDFTPVTGTGEGRTSVVPEGWYGDVWVAVVSQKDLTLDQLASHMVAGPEMVWVSDPQL